MSLPATILLELPDATQLGAVGSKALNLGRLERRGLPTPGGVVIPDTRFQRHLARAGVAADSEALLAGLALASRPALAATAQTLRERITQTALEPALAEALACVWRSRWADRALAVRSSAVGEDSARHSFAGQLDSYLHIEDLPALESAVRATWASLYSLRVLLYARHHDLRPGRMGVIVQPQVAARVSGVLFTRDPTGRQPDSMLAEYCRGLGDEVVAGRVTPARLRIDRRTLEVSTEQAGDSGVTLEGPALGALRRIARIGLDLEAEGGASQDIEWCLDGDWRPVLVQARPATRVAERVPRGEVHWTNANIAENFPEPVSPFLYSIVRPGYTAYFRNLGRAFGVSRRRIAAMAAPLEDIVGLQGGRLYYNLTNIHALLQLMPGGGRLVEFFDLFVGARAIRAGAVRRQGRLGRAVEVLRVATSVGLAYLFIERRVRRFEQRVDEFAAATRPAALPGKATAELAGDLEAFLDIRLNRWTDAALADTAAMVCYGLLKARLSRWLGPGDHAGLHNDLLKGLPGLASAEPVSRLWALSREILADPELRAAFGRESADTLRQQLEQGRFPAFAQRFAAYLEHWGFRSSGELMLTTPTPQEDPRPVLRLLQAYLRADACSPEELSAAQGRGREAETARVATRLSPSWGWLPLASRASRFRILLAATQGAIGLRERARMKQALLYTRLRHITLALGDRLVARGALAARDDVLLLTTAEVLELAAGAAVAGDLGPRIEPRRAALEAARRAAPPDHLVLAPGEAWQPDSPVAGGVAAAAAADRLAGSGACGGTAAGVAAVVLDVADADRVEAGQILVTRQTDPGWATVFFLVRGLVIERGGMLSHGAIIAREYGIPAVVGVPEATQRILNGDRVRVDGDHGIVELGAH